MKVFVTGNQGTAGSMMTRLLDEHGIAWVGYDRKAGLDLMDKAAIKRHIDGCSHVVHLAAIPDAPVRHVKLYTGDKWPAYAEANLVACLKLFDVAEEVGVEHLAMASSCGIFGEPVRYLDKIPYPKNGPYCIDLQNQIEPYSLFKITAQRLLSGYSFYSSVLLLGSVNMHRPQVGHCPVGEAIKIWPLDAANAFLLALKADTRERAKLWAVVRPQSAEIVKAACTYMDVPFPVEGAPNVIDISEEIEKLRFWEDMDQRIEEGGVEAWIEKKG